MTTKNTNTPDTTDGVTGTDVDGAPTESPDGEASAPVGSASVADRAARRLEEVPVEVIDPDPDNRKVTLNAEFVASIRTHGVLEPVLVVPHPDTDGRFLLVAGERRWRAATKAGLATIPAVVRTDMDHQARIEAQVTENLHRSDLGPCEEGVQLARLVRLDHTVKTLAAAVGRSQNHVRARLKLVELPAAGRRLVDTGEWTIEDGLAAVRLVDHPDALADLIAEARYNVESSVKRALNRISFDTALVDLTAQIESDNLTVIDELPRAGKTLTVLGIDSDDHEGEECHAYQLAGNPDWDAAPRLVPVCVKASRHKTTGPSEVKSPHRAGKTDAEREATAAKKAATTARREAMATAAVTKMAKGDRYELILAAFLDRVPHPHAETAVALLDIATDGDGVDGPIGNLHAFAAASEPNRLKAAVVVAMIAHEERFTQNWGGADMAQRWLDWLTARGYQPTDWDRDHLASKLNRP